MLAWMIALVIFSIAAGGLTLLAARRWGIGADEVDGVQKVHRHWVPRLGGVPVFITFAVGCLIWSLSGHLSNYAALLLLVCSLPTFLIGLVEDTTRRAGVGPRLLVTMVSAALGWYFMDGQIRRLDLPLVDDLLARSALASFLITAVAVAGVAHAVNIIDGYNGLCGFFALFAFSAIGAVATLHGDHALAQAALIATLSMVGFLFWNYPMGRLFLGDAGAYFIGFLIAEFCILLVIRNPEVSPWCALLIVIYPVWETLFSMFRRATAGGFSQMGQADALHLHHLVFRRLIRNRRRSDSPHALVLSNSMTAPYLLILVVLSIIPAILFSRQPLILFGFCLLFAVSYGFCYRMIVLLRVQRWLQLRRRKPQILNAKSA